MPRPPAPPLPAQAGPQRRPCLRPAVPRAAPRRRSRSPARSCCWPAASPAPITCGRRWRLPVGLEDRGAVAHRRARRRRAQGSVVAALRRRPARRAAAPGARRRAPRWHWPARGWSRPARSWLRRRRGSCPQVASPRAPPVSASPPTGRSPTTSARTSRRCRTTSCSLLVVSYEVDLAGRVRRSDRRRASASAEQSAADFENTRLLLGADLATAYFNLRAIDIELDVVARSIALQRRSLDFVSARHELGASSGLEVAQQQALLDTTLTQVDLLRRQRGLFEHAVATLTGTPAPSFELAPGHRRARAADGAARRALRRAAAPARRRLGRARDGGGQRADRRRQRRLLSEHHPRPELRRRERAR